MSFTLQIQSIIQYAYNIFASGLPMLYLFLGATFGIFVLGKLLNMAKS